MVQITDKKWKQLKCFFNNIYEYRLLVCPNCGMVYKEGHICETCGMDNSENEANNNVKEWTLSDDTIVI